MKKLETSKTGAQKGFTLIELSIVLVIIGLIVGGVLVGQDLIKAAQIRAALNQIQTYDTAVNAFQVKFNGIPGDLANPANFGFSSSGIGSNLSNGVLDSATPNDVLVLAAEPAAFWNQLSTSNLIPDSITSTGTNGAGDYVKADVSAITTYAPLSKLGHGIYVVAQSNAGVNYYSIGVAAVSGGTITWDGTKSITPIDAYGIDAKLDDGLPNSGIVQTFKPANGLGTADVVGNCTSALLGAGLYLTDTAAHQSAPACTISVRASW